MENKTTMSIISRDLCYRPLLYQNQVVYPSGPKKKKSKFILQVTNKIYSKTGQFIKRKYSIVTCNFLHLKANLLIT